MKIIDLEAHFHTNKYIEYLRGRKTVPREEYGSSINRVWYTDDIWVERNVRVEEKLLDLGENRIREMDEAGIDMQMISLSGPHIQLFEPEEGTYLSKIINDEISVVINKFPARFIGLAAIAPQSPEAAAFELERAVTKLGFKGLLLQSHARDEYLDAKKYWIIFETAEKLDVPIYLHPTIPSKSIRTAFADYGWDFMTTPFGYAVEASLHAVRLIHSGLFDKYPRLKIILGHLGEGLPYWLNRLDYRWLKTSAYKKTKISKKPSYYVKSNFYITTSGMSFLPAFMCAYLALSANNIAFASDYPYEICKEAVHFLKDSPICDGDKEKIAHVTAEKLFKL
ncbi:amidohydrolase family protein [Chloroflexota bacterium]